MSVDGNSALDGAITPAAAVAKLRALGIQVSERTLRARARALGACRIFGNVMFLLPSDVEAILEAAKPVPKQPRMESEPGKVSRWTEYDTEQLLRRLENGSKKKKGPSIGRDTAELLQLSEQMKREEAARKKK